MRIQDCLDFDVEAGTARWRARPESSFPGKRHFLRWNTMYAGKLVKASLFDNEGSPRALLIEYKGRHYLLHRLIWENVNGPIPKGMVIDHANGNKHDNRISNLRLATYAQNAWNMRKTDRNTSGYKGVSWDRKLLRWRVSIQADGVSVYLGAYDDKKEACEVYRHAAKNLHGEFARYE